MKTINLNVQKWLRLCRQAEQAALLRVPNDAAKDLALVAGRLVTVTEPLAGPLLLSMATSLRWECVAFVHADAGLRAQLAEGLRAKAVALRRMLDPDNAPPAAAMAVPAETQPAWARRADIGG